MNAESTLEPVAEIGVSLAGFAGIVGALAGEKLHVLWAVSSAFGSTITAGNLAFFMPRIWRVQRDGVVPKILAFDAAPSPLGGRAELNA